MERYTIARFNEDFPTEDACLEHVLALVYPDGVTCRKCQEVRRAQSEGDDHDNDGPSKPITG